MVETRYTNRMADLMDLHSRALRLATSFFFVLSSVTVQFSLGSDLAMDQTRDRAIDPPQHQKPHPAESGTNRIPAPFAEQYVELLKRGIKEFEVAKSELELQELRRSGDVISTEDLEAARREFELAKRKYQVLQDDYRTRMQELARQVREALDDVVAAEQWSNRVDHLKDRAAVPTKTIELAKSRLTQSKQTSARLIACYEQLELAGEGLIDDLDLFALQPGTRCFIVSEWGLRIAEQPLRGGEQFAKTKYRGGMKILHVVLGSPAWNSGLRRNDILVGLDKWETIGVENIQWILNHINEPAANNPAIQNMKFYILRGPEMKVGHLPLTSKIECTRVVN